MFTRRILVLLQTASIQGVLGSSTVGMRASVWLVHVSLIPLLPHVNKQKSAISTDLPMHIQKDVYRVRGVKIWGQKINRLSCYQVRSTS